MLNNAVCVNLFQSLDFVLHLDLSGSGVELRQTLSLSWVLHLQFEQLQVLQLPAQIVNQLQHKGHGYTELLNIYHVTFL